MEKIKIYRKGKVYDGVILSETENTDGEHLIILNLLPHIKHNDRTKFIITTTSNPYEHKCIKNLVMDECTIHISNIVNVIFNDPATIVFWDDGTKTIVKCCKDETFDPEKGLAIAISKKYFGNISKWLPNKKGE